MKRSKKKEVQKLDLAIMKLTNEEITHFVSAHCEDDKCKTCLKVWKAYGREPIKTTVEKDVQTRLLRKHK